MGGINHIEVTCAPTVNLAYMSSWLGDLLLCPSTSHSVCSTSSSKQHDRTTAVDLMAQKSNCSVIGKQLRNGFLGFEPKTHKKKQLKTATFV